MEQSKELHRHWRAAVDYTRGRSPATFDRWFSRIQFDDLTDGVLSLRATDLFVRDWVCDHYLPSIVEHLRQATGLSIQIAWTVGGVERPVASEPAEAEPAKKRAVRASPKRPPAPAAPPAPAVVAAAPSLPPAPEGLNPKYTFGNFVVGPSKQLAHAAALAAAGGGGRRYSPLFLCGGTGLGKTHLLQAIAHQVLARDPHKRIAYVSAERFTNEFIAAIQHKKMDEFRRRYRAECDLLLVDDVQFLAGREQTQEEFFHTFNALHALEKPIVFTSDTYPQRLERMEERLISRFTWGLVADVQVPELETRVAIVRKKAEVEGVWLEDEVAMLLAQSVRSNVRELEGTLIRLAAKASLLGRPVDLAFARQEIAVVQASRPAVTNVDEIQRAVCHHFQLRSADLLSKDRHKGIALARHVAMYLCKQRLRVSFPELGRAFCKDHTTVISAVRKVTALRESDPQVRAHLDAIERRLTGSG
ncbi:MAG TPA: chromosomal replication initiator protein DnaA [Polyangiaceae bacterium]|nr:chromosomal replication initiator protein DnaA [Polyangiaceae bacterium]